MKARALFCAATLFAALASASPFHLGEPVPDLRLPSLTQEGPLSLSDFRGQKLMLHVWASW